MRVGDGVPPLNDEERAFLAARAAASGTTAATAAAAVEEVTGRRPRRVVQFAGGWGAVPFWATAADGTELVVRVGLEERPYAREAAVLEHVRAAGIPAPEVVGVCRVDDRPVSVLVRVAGAPLCELGERDDVEARRFEAGQWLARLHGIDAGGLDVPPAASAGHLTDIADRLVRTLPAADADVIAAAAARLDGLRAPAPTVLCHLDYGADHVLATSGRITAIIDWEWAGAADPARDVAWWQLYDDALGGGAATVRRGYGPPDDAFDARVRAWMFASCIGAVNFRIGQDDRAGTVGALQHTRELLTAS